MIYGLWNMCLCDCRVLYAVIAVVGCLGYYILSSFDDFGHVKVEEVCGGWFYRCDACGVCLHAECLNGARAKQSAGVGSQGTGVGGAGSSQSGGGGGQSTGVKRSRSSLVGKLLLKAAVRVAVDAATNGLASAVLDSGSADDTSSFDQ
ncbi:hypothetical protein OsJ_25079 [Oryza sativa Japonica Group]|uniref:DC1 domain-containing protein n=1 Tax=Oryza sativa subsp. japonica TaxID=39947 RepID=B9FYD0_ORYSJ|nr:hypothetical protein OsJ_25079 [Oryza sativa Japonica Group]